MAGQGFHLKQSKLDCKKYITMTQMKFCDRNVQAERLMYTNVNLVNILANLDIPYNTSVNRWEDYNWPSGGAVI